MTRKPGVSSAETRQRLLDAGAREFASRGFERASLREICNEAGVTTGALYFFFTNKDDLFSQIIEPLRVALLDLIDEHFREDTLPLPQSLEGLEAEEYGFALKVFDTLERYDAQMQATMANPTHKSVRRLRHDIEARLYFSQMRCYELRHGDAPRNLTHLAALNAVSMQVTMAREIYEAQLSREDTARQLSIAVRFTAGGYDAVLNPDKLRGDAPANG